MSSMARSSRQDAAKEQTIDRQTLSDAAALEELRSIRRSTPPSRCCGITQRSIRRTTPPSRCCGTTPRSIRSSTPPSRCCGITPRSIRRSTPPSRCCGTTPRSIRRSTPPSRRGTPPRSSLCATPPRRILRGAFAAELLRGAFAGVLLRGVVAAVPLRVSAVLLREVFDAVAPPPSSCSTPPRNRLGVPVSAVRREQRLRVPVLQKTCRCQRGVKILSTCHFFDLSFLLTGVEAAMLVNRGGGGAVAPHLFRGPPPPTLSGGISRRLRRARFFPPPPPPTPGRGSGLIPFAVRVRLRPRRAMGPTTAPVVATSGSPRSSPPARRRGGVLPTVPRRIEPVRRSVAPPLSPRPALPDRRRPRGGEAASSPPFRVPRRSEPVRRSVSKTTTSAEEHRPRPRRRRGPPRPPPPTCLSPAGCETPMRR